MDVSTIAALQQPWPVAGRRSLAIIALAALIAIGFFVSAALPYLALDPRVLARYGARVPWVLVHVAAGAVALLTGPVQLWLGVSRRAMRVHRRLGLTYVTSVAIGSVAAFYLAAHTNLGWGFASGITGLGIAWVVTTALAVAAIRRGLIEQHRDWMIRSYVVTFGFVTFRAAWLALQAAGVGTREEQLAMSSWFCWAAPLLVVEAILHGRRIFATRRLAAGAIGFVALVIMPASVGAQARLTAADLHGQVRDESGSILPDALVAIVNTETSVIRPLATDARGEFHALALPPGIYRVTIDRPGFATETRDGIVLLLGQSISLDVTLKIAAAREAVTVVAETPVVDPGHTAVSSVVRQQQVDSLPIDGRNFMSFTVITPGVTTDRTPQQGATGTSGLSFGGQRGRSNNIMVDGLDNNDATVGAVRATFSQEAIREFQVLTNSYSAEFGKAAGGVVNIVTRSGTNDLRGTVFGYYRDDTLNARDHFERFDPFGAPIERGKAPFGQVQWGGVAGGPIRKGKTFFFGSFEQLKIDAHNFVNIDAHARDVLAASGFAVELGHVPYTIGTTEVLGKIDHQFSPTSALVIRANVSDTTNENIEPFGGLVARSRGAALLRDDAAVAASHTHVFGRWLNEARVQFARQDLTVNSLDPACSGACEGDHEGGPTLELPGVASVGRQRFTPQARKNDRYQLMETLSFAAGRHALKAGGEFNYLDNRLAAVPLHFGGRFIFAALPANPALGLSEPISAVQALERGLPAAYIQGYGNPQFVFGQRDVSAFLQDEWRIGKTLTIKPGLRYQKQLWPDSSYDVSTTGGDRLRYRLRQSGTIAPRMAVAYDPAGDGRTSVHAAYGRYDDYQFLASVVTGQIVNGSSGVRTLALRLPSSIAAWTSPGHQLPEPAAAFPSVEISTASDLKGPYAMHTAVGVDRAIGRRASLSANFVRVRGRNQLGTIDYNPIVPALGPGRRPNDIDGRAGTSASVLQYTPFGESWYDGLTVSLNKPLGRQQFFAAYTVSKAEDTSTDFQTAFLPEHNGAGRDPSDPDGLPRGFDPRRERGPATHDQRHRLVISGLTPLPLGLQLSSIVTAASGRPFTPLAGADLNGDGDGGAFPSDRARRNPADPASSVGRNSGTMPAQVTVDVRLSKRIAVRERAAVVVLAEAFNLFNRSDFSEVNAVFGRGAFPDDPQRDAQGRVTYGLFEQALPPRQVQVALRVSF